MNKTDFGISYKEVSEIGKLIKYEEQGQLDKKANKNLSILALENWINDTLNEADYFQIPGCIKVNKVGEGESK